MARSVNQTVAWIFAVVFSVGVFGVGYLVIKASTPHQDHDLEHMSEGDASSHSAASSHGHGEPAKIEAEEHHSAAPAHDSHAAPATSHDAPHSAGGEEEISADQFKGKSEHH